MRLIVCTSGIVALVLAAPAGSIVNLDEVSEAVIRSELAQLPLALPGEYETTIEFSGSAPIPDGAQTKASYCLTEAMATGDGRGLLRATRQNDCRFERLEVDGEAIDAVLWCNAMSRGGTARMTINGTMGREISSLQFQTVASLPAAPTTSLTFSMKVDSRRSGDCTAASRAEAVAEEERRQRDEE